MENEDADPVGADAITVYTELAIKHGLVGPGQTMTTAMVDFAAAIVSRCAKIGDGYTDKTGHTAGEHIRSTLWPY